MPAMMPARSCSPPSVADTFATSDGEFVLAVGNDDQFRRMASALGAPQLAGDARFETNRARVEHYPALREQLRAICASWTRDRIVRTLMDAGVPCGAVRSVTEALQDPQLAARDMIVPIAHATAGTIRVLGNPLKMSDTPPEIRSAPPALGQHTDEILRNDAGLDDEAIASLRRVKAID